jgi:hypothetical protein
MNTLHSMSSSFLKYLASGRKEGKARKNHLSGLYSRHLVPTTHAFNQPADAKPPNNDVKK